jgi:hypothetical protein
LAVGVIQPRCKARLVCAVCLSALGQPRPMPAGFAAVALTPVVGTADIEHCATFRIPKWKKGFFFWRR